MSRRRSRRVLLVVAGTVAAAGVALPAVAAWNVLSKDASGSSAAATLPKGSTPTATASGRNAVVSWTASKVSGTTDVAGYALARFSGAGDAQTITGGCNIRVTSTSCTEKGLAPGSYSYTVTPVQGDKWTGTASDRGPSGGITIASPAVTSNRTTVTSSGGTATLTLSNFLDNASVKVCIDDTTATCTSRGTSTIAATGGTGSATVTIPAGLTVGEHRLHAIDTADPAAVGSAAPSVAFTVTHGPATKLAFTTQPGGAAANANLNPQPVVTVQDAYGNTVTDSTAPINLAKTTTSGSGSFSCTTNPLNAAAGIATFTGCKVSASGTYAITASSTGLTSATSNNFAVTAVLAPTITSPTTALPVALQRGGTRNFTISGTGFQPNASVSISGGGVGTITVTANSPTSLTVSVTLTGTANTGLRNLTVTNPDTQSASQRDAINITS